MAESIRVPDEPGGVPVKVRDDGTGKQIQAIDVLTLPAGLAQDTSLALILDAIDSPLVRDVSDRAARQLGVVSAANLDISLSVLRDAITRTGETAKTLADVVTALGPLATEATATALLAEFRARYDAVLTAKATYTTSGDHELITPASGQALRAVWLYAQAKAALDTGTVLVTFTLGSNSYEVELTGSQPFAHAAVWEGGADQKLIVTTSSTAAVLVNADYRVMP